MFGIRVHAGEINVSPSEQSIDVACRRHLEITRCHLKRLLVGLANKEALFPGESTIPYIRIGHGVAFVAEFRHELYLNSSLAAFEKLQIPIEINLTSNDYLLPSSPTRGRRHMLVDLVSMQPDMKNNVIICCDNDGIWPLDSAKYHIASSDFVSIPCEFERAITENMLSSEEVCAFVENARRFSFLQDKPEDHSRTRLQATEIREILATSPVTLV